MNLIKIPSKIKKDKNVFYLKKIKLSLQHFMFTKACEYGIRAMIYIARLNEPGKKIGIKEIAKGIDAPLHFTAKILQDLGKKDLVQSTKGPNGGFYLENSYLDASIADVVKAIDGDQLFVGCGLGLAECSEKMPCPIHHEFKKIREQITELLHSTKFIHFHENKELKLNFLR